MPDRAQIIQPTDVQIARSPTPRLLPGGKEATLPPATAANHHAELRNRTHDQLIMLTRMRAGSTGSRKPPVPRWGCESRRRRPSADSRPAGWSGAAQLAGGSGRCQHQSLPAPLLRGGQQRDRPGRAMACLPVLAGGCAWSARCAGDAAGLRLWCSSPRPGVVAMRQREWPR